MPRATGENPRKRLRVEESDEKNDVESGDEYETDAQAGPFLACPFYKFNPRVHYRCLEKYKMKRIPDVKQHLMRRHVLKGNYHCSKCSARWKSPGPWEKHIQRGVCQPAARLDKLYPEETRILENIPKGPDPEKWFFIWDNLFTGHDRPSSPYIRDGMAEPQGLIRHDGEAALQKELPKLLEEFNISLDMTLGPSFVAHIGRIMFDTPSAVRLRLRLHPAIGNAGHEAESVTPAPTVATPMQEQTNARNRHIPTHGYHCVSTPQMGRSRPIYRIEGLPTTPGSQSLLGIVPPASTYIGAGYPTITPVAESFVSDSFNIPTHEGHNLPQTAFDYTMVMHPVSIPVVEEEPFDFILENDGDYSNIMFHGGNEAELDAPGGLAEDSITSRSGHHY